MNDLLEIGDTICCNNFADMMDVMEELREQGYLATAEVGYTVRIHRVPDTNEEK